MALETVWHGAAWREAPQPTVATEKDQPPPRYQYRTSQHDAIDAHILRCLTTRAQTLGEMVSSSHWTYRSVQRRALALELEGRIQSTETPRARKGFLQPRLGRLPKVYRLVR